MAMILRDAGQLTQLMQQRGVSARRLADLAGWSSHTYMQRLLRGEARAVRPEAARKIARALGVPVDALFLPRQSRNTGRGDK